MATTFTLDQTAFPVGSTVKAYVRGGESYRNAEPPGAVAATAVVSAGSDLDYAGLAYGTNYWAAALVAGVWRWVGFTTVARAAEIVTTAEPRTGGLEIDLPAGTTAERALAIFKGNTEAFGIGPNGELYFFGSATSPAMKPGASDKVQFVAGSGNDSNDGLSWGSAKRTIMAAVNASPRPETIYVGGGTFVETVTPKSGQWIVGSGAPSFTSTVIQPPNDSAAGVVMMPTAVVSNLMVSAAGTTYAGRAFDLTGAAQCKVINCRAYHGDLTDFAGGKGGTGIYATNCEGAYVENLQLSNCQIGKHLASEASDNLFVNTRTSSCWKTHVSEGTGGGNVFVHWKAVACRGPVSFDVAGDDGVYIGCDWDEAGPNAVNISGDKNLFSKHTIAPGATMTDSGFSNHWQKPKFLGVAIFTGTDPVIEDMYNLGTVDVSGATRPVIDGINITTGPRVTGLAVARIKPVTGPPIVAPAGALIQKVPYFDADKKLLGWLELSAQGVSTYQDAVMVDRPVAYWLMGETSGTVAADLLGVSDAVYQGAPTLGQAGATADGVKAVLFDGSTSGQRMNINNTPTPKPLVTIADVFTIEMWIKRSNLVGSPTLFDSGVGFIRVGLVAGTNSLVLAKSGVSNICISTVGITNDGSFHHVAITKNGATVKLYIDGVDRSGAVTNATLVATTSNVAIGGAASPGTPFPGLMQHVAVYDYALSGARAAAHFAAV